jgi:hypothetical protein
MEYRGIEYQIVQTAVPAGWKWTVFIEAKPMKTGSSGSHTLAKNAAEASIRKHLKMEERRKLVLSAEVSDSRQS